MKMQFVRKSLAGIVALALGAAVQVQAQANFGGQFGGGGGGQGRQSTAASTTFNAAGTIGNAQISVDSDTHNLIINADDETTKAIMQVIRNLDHPQPQVLI